MNTKPEYLTELPTDSKTCPPLYAHIFDLYEWTAEGYVWRDRVQTLATDPDDGHAMMRLSYPTLESVFVGIYVGRESNW